MDLEALYSLSENIAIEIENTKEYKDLKELKNKIDESLNDKIKTFKSLQEKYEEASKYGEYYPGYQKLKKDFIDAKADLYKSELVKEYFVLERKVQKMLDDIKDDIISSIHNKEEDHDSKKVCHCVL